MNTSAVYPNTIEEGNADWTLISKSQPPLTLRRTWVFEPQTCKTSKPSAFNLKAGFLQKPLKTCPKKGTLEVGKKDPNLPHILAVSRMNCHAIITWLYFACKCVMIELSLQDHHMITSRCYKKDELSFAASIYLYLALPSWLRSGFKEVSVFSKTTINIKTGKIRWIIESKRLLWFDRKSFIEAQEIEVKNKMRNGK